MRFLMMTTNDATTPLPPPTPELYAEMGKLIEEMTKCYPAFGLKIKILLDAAARAAQK